MLDVTITQCNGSTAAVVAAVTINSCIQHFSVASSICKLLALHRAVQGRHSSSEVTGAAFFIRVPQVHHSPGLQR